jgi:PAS domain S-box-containing protein
MVPLSCCVTDQDGRFTQVNRMFEETSGYSSSEVLGKTSIELGLNSPGNGEFLKKSIAKTGRIESTESITRLPNGEERTVLISSRSVSINTAPRIITAIFDVTDLKRAEETLRKSGEYFRAMIDQSPFSIIVFTPDGNAVHANEAHCRLWGITMDKVLGYNVFRDPQMERLGLLTAFRRAFAGEQLTVPPTRYDLGATLGMGQKRMVRGDFYPIRDGNGMVTHVILVHQDFPDGAV